MSRTTNVRAAVIKTRYGVSARRGHVRRINAYRASNYRAQTGAISAGSLNDMWNDVFDTSTVSGAAFEITQQESIDSSPRARYVPEVVRDDTGEGWVDIANSDWEDVPKSSGHAQMRESYSKKVIERIASELEVEEESSGKRTKRLNFLAAAVSTADGRMRLADQIGEEMWDMFTPNEFKRSLAPEQIRERKNDIKATSLAALESLSGSQDLRDELSKIHGDQIGSNAYRGPGGVINLNSVEDSDLVEATAAKSHLSWRSRREPPLGEKAVEPLVFEDEHGNLVNVNNKSAYIPPSVMEEMRERTESELMSAMSVMNNQSSIFKGTMDKKIALEIFSRERFSLEDQATPNFEERRKKAYDRLPDEERTLYVAKASMRRKQVKEFGIEDTFPARPPRRL